MPAATGRHPAHAALRGMLYERFFHSPAPILAGEAYTIPAASLWTGARVWVHRFRELGLAPGDRVVLGLPPGAGAFMALVACLWEGVCAWVDPSGGDVPRAIEAADARLAIADGPGEHTLGVYGAGLPTEGRVALRDAGPATPGVALLMASSGSTGSPKRVALSWGNVLAQVRSHTAALAHDQASVVMSVLSWSHAFGLLVDVLPAMLRGATVITAHHHARDPARLVEIAERWGVTHLSLVPSMASGMLDTGGGSGLLRGLRGGIVGGAPVGAELAEALACTKLRAGYGQTETSPGITLGEPGDWREGWLGGPIACDIRTDAEGQLHVRGPNVCHGLWERDTLLTLPEGRWHATGDIVERVGDGYRFVGRMDDRFKLDNGRIVEAPRLERALRETLPQNLQPVIFTADGSTVSVALIGSRIPDQAAQAVRGALAGLWGRFAGIVHITPEACPRTAKGQPDRRALAHGFGVSRRVAA